MKKASYKIEFVRGDSYSLFARQRTRVWDENANEGLGGYVPGPYRDLTGWTGLCQARFNVTSTEVVFTFAVTLGDQVAAPGSFFLTVEPEDTKDLTGDNLKGVWDLQWTTADGEVFTPLGGEYELDGDVSRA